MGAFWGYFWGGVVLLLGASGVLAYAAGMFPVWLGAGGGWLAQVWGGAICLFCLFARAFGGPKLSPNFEGVGAGTLQPQCDLSARL